jgi:hypothetical protein
MIISANDGKSCVQFRNNRHGPNMFPSQNVKLFKSFFRIDKNATFFWGRFPSDGDRRFTAQNATLSQLFLTALWQAAQNAGVTPSIKGKLQYNQMQ